MAYDEKLADRIRKVLKRSPSVAEINMFGGLCFTIRGNMCCGTLNNDLVLRIGPQHYERALGEPHARPMDFTGRPIKGFVYVGPAGYKTDASLLKWVGWARDFVGKLPEKIKRGSPKQAAARKQKFH